MKISGFTIARNAVKFNYPLVESIRSILPICDEFVVNAGDSEDETLALIRSIHDPKIRVIQRTWDMTRGREVLADETNAALKECRGDWAFYLQSDEVVHEEDLPRLKNVTQKFIDDPSVDALRFQWFHFYGSFYRYRIDQGWYQKQDRIIRNNGAIESYGDAFGFRRKDNRELRRRNTGCYMYHYGWVQPEDMMAERLANARTIGFADPQVRDLNNNFSYGDLNRFPVYFGTHPGVMKDRIDRHTLSGEDLKNIERRYWWFPPKILKIRYKTGKRVRERINK